MHYVAMSTAHTYSTARLRAKEKVDVAAVTARLTTAHVKAKNGVMMIIF